MPEILPSPTPHLRGNCLFRLTDANPHSNTKYRCPVSSIVASQSKPCLSRRLAKVHQRDGETDRQTHTHTHTHMM